MHCNALSLDLECVGHNLHSCFLLCAQNFPTFLHEMDLNESYHCVLGIHRIKIIITWREREHEEQNMISLNDLRMVRALGDCGLLKYFIISGLRQNMELLEFLVCSWDPTIETFHIGDKVVPILVEGIFFLTGLSRRGSPISLSGSALGGETVRDYILQHCHPGVSHLYFSIISVGG